MASSLSAVDSAAAAYVRQFEYLGPVVAPRVILAAWDQLPVLEQAALAADWSFWGRSKQLPPAGDWKTWGYLTGRGFGKTTALSHFLVDAIEQGRAPLSCVLAQDEQSAIDLQILGPSGLVATAPPWFRPTWEASALQLAWPNGARTYVRTPEVPGKIRGLEYHLTWASELQSWPNSTRDESWDNVLFSTRLGEALILWDATPKKRHPILKKLLAEAEADPIANRIVRGSMSENESNLANEYVARMKRKYGGTQRGREELEGEMLAENEQALFRQEWIDRNRRARPERFRRKVISIDPAVTNRRGSDTTGMIEAGEGLDGRGYVIKDGSKKQDPGTWGQTALDWYVKDDCDLIIAETNKGGSLIATTLRALGQLVGLEVIVVDRNKPRPLKQPGKVFVLEVHARGDKADRAEPVATAYERDRVTHVDGADLSSLEETITSYEAKPNEDSPGDLDAMVHAMVELLGLANNEADPAQGFVGIVEASRQVQAPPPQSAGIAQVLSTAFSSRNRI